MGSISRAELSRVSLLNGSAIFSSVPRKLRLPTWPDKLKQTNWKNDTVLQARSTPSRVALDHARELQGKFGQIPFPAAARMKMSQFSSNGSSIFDGTLEG
jgi:hypothetical protein